jgi:hypothetical protein
MRTFGLIILSIFLLGCPKSSFPKFRCTKGHPECPLGYTCHQDGYCYKGDASIATKDKGQEHKRPLDEKIREPKKEPHMDAKEEIPTPRDETCSTATSLALTENQCGGKIVRSTKKANDDHHSKNELCGQRGSGAPDLV